MTERRFNKGDRFVVPAGVRVYGTFPPSIATGYEGGRPYFIYKRDMLKTVVDFHEAFSPESHLDQRYARDAEITFVGPGGYWGWISPDSVKKID